MFSAQNIVFILNQVLVLFGIIIEQVELLASGKKLNVYVDREFTVWSEHFGILQQICQDIFQDREINPEVHEASKAMDTLHGKWWLEY